MFKKYSKLMIMSAVMLITWIVYYVNIQNLTDSFARFEFKTIEGDDSLIESIVMKGDMSTSYFTYEPFVLTKNGTLYFRETSLIDRFGDYYKSEKVKQLQEDYRQFMRGKNETVNSYATTEEKVVYADFIYSDFGFNPEKIKIETYDRRSKEKKQAIIDVPELMTYSYIEKVIPAKDGVYVIVESYISDHRKDTHEVEWYIYFYDFTNEVAHEPMIVDSGEIYAYNNLLEVFVDNENDPRELIITAGYIDYEIVDHEDGAFESAAEEYEQEVVEIVGAKKINLDTKEISDINMKDKKIGIPIAYNGEEIIFVDKNKGEIYFSTYHIKTNEVKERVTVPVDIDYFSYWDFNNSISKNNHVYTLLNAELSDKIMLLVFDEDEMKLSYKGTIENVNEKALRNEIMTIYFNEMEILD